MTEQRYLCEHVSSSVGRRAMEGTLTRFMERGWKVVSMAPSFETYKNLDGSMKDICTYMHIVLERKYTEYTRDNID